MKITLAPRIIAFLLALTLCGPNSAFALRGQQQEDPSQLAGLEEALKDPAKALRRLAQLVTPAPAQINGTSSGEVRPRQPYAIERAGMEELGYLSDEVEKSSQLREQVLAGEIHP